MKKYIFILFIIFFQTHVHSQDNFTLIKGRILNKNDSTPLYNVHIYTQNSQIGTTTNKNGKFIFHIPKDIEVQEIFISCMGFKTYIKDINEDKTYVTIYLIEEELMLSNVTIIALSSQEIINKCLNNIKKNYYQEKFSKILYYKEFYAQNDKPLRYLEVVADMTTKGFNPKFQKRNDFEFNIIQKRAGFNFDKEFEGGNGIGTVHAIRNFIKKYLSVKQQKNYLIEYKGITRYRDNEVYVISFMSPNDAINTSALLYITTDSFALIAFNYSYNDPNTSKPKKGFKFLEFVKYIDFIKLNDGYWYIHSIDDYRISIIEDGTITEMDRSIKVTDIKKEYNNLHRKIDIHTDLYTYPVTYNSEFWEHYNVPPETIEEREFKKELKAQELDIINSVD